MLARCLAASVIIAHSFLGDVARAETIVLVRHGEKPKLGLGQLSCQGLNRALALPAVIRRLFGTPDAVFAPDPAVQKADAGKDYDYVRPLATIEPTAIAFGLPVNARLGLDDVAGLAHALEAPALADKLVVVAWEHKLIVPLARSILADFHADPGQVPAWSGSDFDSIYVIRTHGQGAGANAAFAHAHEGLDGRPMTCP